jgi:transposase
MSNERGSNLPTDVRGFQRVDDRGAISGIVHVLKSGCRWCDCPPDYGPPTTIYNRFRAGRGAAFKYDTTSSKVRSQATGSCPK